MFCFFVKKLHWLCIQLIVLNSWDCIKRWDFGKKPNLGKSVIIGVLDTGITPNHPSFRDHGLPPPPAKWKGKREFEGMACNNKLIGARTFQYMAIEKDAFFSKPPLIG